MAVICIKASVGASILKAIIRLDTASMESTTSSKPEVRAWMSSRSMGVMKVRFNFSTIS